MKSVGSSLRDRITRYGVALSAGALAVGSTADADVILYDNGGAGWTVNVNGPALYFNIDGSVGNGNTNADFFLRNNNTFSSKSSSAFQYRQARVLGQNRMLFSRLDSGELLNSADDIRSYGQGFTDYGIGRNGWTLSSGPNSTGYVGLKFDDQTTVNYGWAEITLSPAGANPNGPQSITLNRYAVETTPDLGIVTGTVPEPATISLLALGVVGLARFRRRK